MLDHMKFKDTIIKQNNNFYDSYFNSLSKVQKNKEYQLNKSKINCIKKALIEHADVPEQLIDWLIESVEENVALEYEFSLFKNKTY